MTQFKPTADDLKLIPESKFLQTADVNSDDIATAKDAWKDDPPDTLYDGILEAEVVEEEEELSG